MADHSDNMGLFPDARSVARPSPGRSVGPPWYEMIQKGEGGKAAFEIIAIFGEGKFPQALQVAPGTPAYRDAWQDTIKAAEEYNDPGRFTAFIGYEWTVAGRRSTSIATSSFATTRRGPVRSCPLRSMPPSAAPIERDLWKWMQAYEDKTGGDVLAIAHNGNLSNGRMFPLIEFFTGKPIDRDYAEARNKWEHLYEVDADEGRRRVASVPVAQ